LQNKVSHAYLFSGIRGIGKTTLARLFAKSLNCSNRSKDCEPCNECSSCIEITNANSLDVLEIDGASNRGIDDIRNLNDTLGYATFEGRYKIFIIDEVHMLTKEAFNALLKSLEEPPDNVKFFLATTEPKKVLPTIVSRCQRFDLARIEAFAIIKKLRHVAKEYKVEVEDDALSLIARLSEGSLRDAESLFDQIICFDNTTISANTVYESLGFVSKQELFQLDLAYLNEEISFGFTLAHKLFTTGKDLGFFVETLFEHYRNISLLLLEKITLDSPSFSEEECEGYKKALEIYSLNQVLYILDYLTKLTLQQMRSNWKKIHLEMALLHIIQSKNRISIDQIMAHIQELKSQNPKEVLEIKQEKPVLPSKKPQENLVSVVQNSPSPAEAVEKPKSEQVQKPKEKETIKVPDSLRHETILRFAAVELNGSLKKNV